MLEILYEDNHLIAVNKKSGDIIQESNKYWQEKPLWCQPWSIIIAGILIIGISYFWLHNYLITGLLSFLISIWWILFLFIAPKSYDIYK